MSEKRRDERPPIGMRAGAMQQQQTRLRRRLPRFPGQELDLRALDGRQAASGRVKQRARKPLRRRRALAVERRQRLGKTRIVHELFQKRRLGEPRRRREPLSSRRARASQRL